MKYIPQLPTLFAILAPLVAHAQTFDFDGVSGGGDNYSTTEVIGWFNGHETEESIYGDFGDQQGSLILRYGVGTVAGDSSGTQYFFVNVEAPLYVKNMIWEDADWKGSPLTNTNAATGLTEADVSSYRTHHETHHKAYDMKLDFNGATGSEKVIFLNGSGGGVLEVDVAGSADKRFGLVDHKDSVDYLFDNGLATEALSLNRDMALQFEFRFALDPTENEAFLDMARNGIELHLSPERGLATVAVVPEPGSATLVGLAGVLLLIRRRRSSE